MSTSPPMETDGGARIERLLDELRASSGPQIWPRVEELVRELTAMYGRGLARLLELTAPSAETLRGDELVSSLLALHGLHPEPTEVRVRAAIGPASLLSIEGGVARIHVENPAMVAAVERSVLEAAPELERVEVTAGPLVQIRMRR